MRPFSRYLPLTLVAPVLALPLLAAPAAADPLPDLGMGWPMCSDPADTDDQYCIVEVTRDGVDMPLAAGTTDGDYEVPVVRFVGPGAGAVGNDVVIDIEHWLRQGSPMPPDLGDISPTAEWVFELNTGQAHLTELTGTMRGVTQTTAGSDANGWTTRVTLHPVPVAWLSDWEACTFENGCGDDSTVADLVRDGFVTARLSDGTTEGRPAWAVKARAGLVEVGNAHGTSTEYDVATNTLVVRLVNPHLRSSSPDVVAHGWFETFLPDAWLIANYQVPDPTTLVQASFSVRREGSTAPVSYTVTRASDGVWIQISDFGFSAPVFQVKPKPSVPGVPRWGSVTRVGAHAVTVRFRAPVADGGADITKYTARCRRGDLPWHRASAPASPVTVRDLPRKPVTCQVRAVNRIGAGLWSAARAE